MNEMITDSLGSWLLKTSIEGTVLIGIVFILIALLGRNLSPRWRVSLWVLVGLKLLIPASVTFMPGIGNWAAFSAPAQPAVPAHSAVITPAQIIDVEATLNGPAFNSPATAPPSVAISLTSVFIIIWLIGAVGFLVTILVKQSRFVKRSGSQYCSDRRLLSVVDEVSHHLNLNRRVLVMLGKAGSTPAVFGVYQPRLLLPEDWAERFDESSLRHILLHELEHVRFGDVLWNWTAALVNALHWFNPLVWLATARFQADRELRCDADTLARLEAPDRVAYGRTLLHVQQTFHAAPAVAGLAPCVRNHSALRQRIAMITKPTTSHKWLNLIFTLALAGLICLSFGSAARADGEREGGDRREGEGRREGPRDGDREREGSRERDGDRPREGTRDGEREGDRAREGARDGERGQVRDGELKVTVTKDGVIIGDRKLALINLRGALEKSKANTAVVYANENVPFQNVKTVVNALGNSGIKNVRFATDDRPEGARDGDRPREGARDGEMRREGARDGEGGPAREGARDGDRPREGARDGEMRREGARDGEGGPAREGARDGDRPREGARDGEMRREGARDGEGGPAREGARDGDRPREGARDGEMRREGARDGEGGPAREGARDGDRPREGARDGEMRREGARDGEGGPAREGARDGDRPREGGEREGARSAEERGSAEMDDRQLAQLSRIFKTYDKDNSKTVTFKEWVAMKNYKLSSEQEEREKGWFDQADANDNGELTIGEWIDWKSSQGR